MVNFGDNNLSSAIKGIAEKLAYSGKVEKLMQVARVNKTEKHNLAILYALNKRKLRNSVLDDYIYATLSLGIADKGKSRKELIDVVKAGSVQLPKGFINRMKDSFDG